MTDKYTPESCPSNRCSFVLTNGPNKGLCCSAAAYKTKNIDGLNYCARHYNKLTTGTTTPSRKKKEKELNDEVPKDKSLDAELDILNKGLESPLVIQEEPKQPVKQIVPKLANPIKPVSLSLSKAKVPSKPMPKPLRPKTEAPKKLEKPVELSEAEDESSEEKDYTSSEGSEYYASDEVSLEEVSNEYESISNDDESEEPVKPVKPAKVPVNQSVKRAHSKANDKDAFLKAMQQARANTQRAQPEMPKRFISVNSGGSIFGSKR